MRTVSKTVTVTETFEVYTYENAPEEVKEKIRQGFEDDIDHYEHCMSERIDTLKALAETIKGELDYSISCVPDRGEYIKIKPLYEHLDFTELERLSEVEVQSCYLTGVCYDQDIMSHFSEYGFSEETLEGALLDYIEQIHDEYQDMISHSYIKHLCEINDYEFKSDGSLYHAA